MMDQIAAPGQKAEVIVSAWGQDPTLGRSQHPHLQ